VETPATESREGGGSEKVGGRLPWALRALSSRSFRLYFCGQSISLVGSWITTATNAWLIYHLTGNNLLLGLSSFCAQAPTLLLAPIGGVLVDRWDLRRTLLVTQSLAMLQSLLLAALCWSLALPGEYVVGAILALQLFQGAINSVDLPARQSFGIQMVDRREDLPNAIALNSTMVNLSRLIGPAIAGAMIAAGIAFAGEHPRAGERGAAWGYSVDVLTYVPVLAALLLMTPRVVRKATERKAFWHELREGLSYVRTHATLRSCLLLLTVSSFFGVAVNTQLAAIAKSVLGVGPKGYGMLVAGVGLGASCSAIFLATRRTTEKLPRYIAYASVTFAAAVIALSFTHSFLLALPITAVMGAAMVLQAASTNTLCQTLSDDDKRGRVMSFFTMSFMGTVPLGALALGATAQFVGESRSVLIWGAVLMLATVVAFPTLWRVPGVRGGEVGTADERG
jgi:MFS family permease